MADTALCSPATHPFDALADDYDRSFVDTRLGRWLRAAVWEVLADNFSAGDRILELGSATGEDAVWLAARGIEVTGTDASAKMLGVARTKAARAAGAERLTFHQIDWNAPHASIPEPRPYDGLLANFGVLNCIRDRRALAARLAPAMRPGARVVVVMMGPICAWEIAWRLGHGTVRDAFRRLRTNATAQLDGAVFPVWYPSSAHLREEFAPWFRRRAVSGLGFLLPPTDLGHLVDRWPRAFARLRTLDAALARRAISAWLADHYIAVFERTECEPMIRERDGAASAAPRLDRRLARRVRSVARWLTGQEQSRKGTPALSVEQVHGVTIIILPQVFNGIQFHTGAFMAETLSAELIPADASVLDLGTGSGIGAIFAARWAARVVATDINPEAARCARINALAHHLEHIVETRTGDLFEPVRGERFDLILFNPPYFRGVPQDAADHALRSPDTFDRFLRALPEHLTPRGRALIVLSPDTDIEDALWAAPHLSVSVHNSRQVLDKMLRVYDVRVKGGADAT